MSVYFRKIFFGILQLKLIQRYHRYKIIWCHILIYFRFFPIEFKVFEFLINDLGSLNNEADLIL